MKILFLNDYTYSVGGAEVVIKNVMEQSRHDIDLRQTSSLSNIDLGAYDAIHLHSPFKALSHRKKLINRRVVWSVHDYILACEKQSGLCFTNIVPANCTLCHGLTLHINALRRGRAVRDLVHNYLSRVVVHSKWMQLFYAKYSPRYLPIPLETRHMSPSKNKENYLFFSSRCSFEKNPLAFVNLCDELGVRGVMALYSMTQKSKFKDYMRKFKSSSQIEVFTDLEEKELFDLYKHAKLTVHPHMYLEPFGIGSVNSILLGTPLVAYPFGNLRNIATVTAYPFRKLVDTVRLILVDDTCYSQLLSAALDDRVRLIKEHDSIRLWDRFYSEL